MTDGRFSTHDSIQKVVITKCIFRLSRLTSHQERYHDKDKNSDLDNKSASLDDKSIMKVVNTWIREELDSDNEDKGFTCECGKSYVTKRSLVKHRLSVHDSHIDASTQVPVEFTCAECGKSFDKIKTLKNHERIHKKADEEFKRFLCHICGQNFRQNTGLTFHMRTHNGYKPHICR